MIPTSSLMDMDIKNTLHTLHTYRDDDKQEKEYALEDMIGSEPSQLSQRQHMSGENLA